MNNSIPCKGAGFPPKVASCLLVVLLFACSSGFPSESTGRQVLENHYGKYPGAYKVKSFTKTNGVEIPPNAYSLEFEAEIECLRDLKLEPGDILIRDEYGLACVKAGIQKLQGKIKFEKTEKGWRAEDGKIY